MGKIKKILENELVGGTQTTDVYPVTSTKAVYDENNERLDNILEGWRDKIGILKNAGYLYAGVATIDTDPGIPNARVFYIADGKGTYTNFGGLEVAEDEVVLLCYDTAWHKDATGIASQEKLTDLDSQIILLIGGDGVLHSEEMQDGVYYITNVNTNVVTRSAKEGYKTCSPIDISNCVEDTVITIKSSIVSNIGVYVCDENMVALDYINSENAEERGYTITTQWQDISIKKPINAKYIVSSLRDTYNPTISDFDVHGTIIGKIQQIENDIEGLKTQNTTLTQKITQNKTEIDTKLTELEGNLYGKNYKKPIEINLIDGGNYTSNTPSSLVTGLSANIKYCDAVDISAYRGGSLTITIASQASGSRYSFITDESGNTLVWAAEKNFIANADGTYSKIFNLEDTAKYFYFSSARTLVSVVVDIKKGGEIDKIKASVNNLETRVSELESKVGDDTVDTIKKITVIGKNLLDESKCTDAIIQSNGSISPSTTYFTSDYIYIKQGEIVTISSKVRRLIAYNAPNESSVITSSYVDNPKAPYIFEASQDCFLRVSFPIEQKGIAQIEYGTNKTSYQAYTKFSKIEEGVYPSKDLSQGNVLFGKKWCAIGDSFTEGLANDLIEEGKYKGEHKCYPYLIGNRNWMEIVQFFRGGRTMAYPASGDFTNSLTCPSDPWYYQNIPSDADYITIMLGINDLNHGVGTGEDGEDYTGLITLGTIEDTDTSTYYGAWNTVMSWLMVNRPFAHVGIIVTNGTQNEAFTSAQIEIAKKYGVPYINLNGDQHTPAMIRAYNPNLPQSVKDAIKTKQAVDLSANNTHPNTAAHNYESTFIENWLRGL